MALVHLRALQTVNALDESGTRVTYRPGDWFQIGKQRAIELIETGQAEMPANVESQRAITEDLEDCGILVYNGTVRDAREAAGHHKLDAQELKGALYLPWERTLIWNAHYPLSSQQIALGLVRIQENGRYNSWEMAVMLQGAEKLAREIGDQEERDKTRESIGDLRLPVYETSAIWMRRTPRTEPLLQAYNLELAEGAMPEHAFLRALYANRVLLCTLPAGWLRRLT